MHDQRDRMGRGARGRGGLGRRLAGRVAGALALCLALSASAVPAQAGTGSSIGGTAQAQLPEGCRVPSDEQLEAGGALEAIMLALHGLVVEQVPLVYGVAFGDPGPCPGGSLDAYRGVDIMGWALEVSGPAVPTICSPDDPPVLELPLRSTRCVDPSTVFASRNARVPYGELRSRAPFPLLLPTTLPDDVAPHWTTLRVTDWRADAGNPRQYGTILRYRGADEDSWLVLLEDTGALGDWMVDTLSQDAPTVPLRGTQAVVLAGLPEYDGPGQGLFWEESGLRLVLFGTYPLAELTAVAEAMTLQPPQPSVGRRDPQSVAAS